MGKTVAETIRELTNTHLNKNNGIILGQCLTAVGWVQNTIPKQKKGIVELSMTDVAGSGMAVGAAIGGARPIFVMRFQSLVWLNSSPIVMHAARSKEIFGYGCPVFIRAIASESSLGQGPLHANNYHSIFAHIPNFRVAAPMTPIEYRKIWNFFCKNDLPIFVSEHRNSYQSDIEIKNIYKKNAKLSIIAISSARFESFKAIKILEKKNIKCNLINIVWLNPFKLSKKEINEISKSKIGLVIDASYEHCGIISSIAYKIIKLTGVKVFTMGLKNKSPGVGKNYENGTPKAEYIEKKITEILKKKN